jgi:outer membrane receptor for ferrienterochelin and colicin
MGYLFPGKPYQSIGFLTSATWYSQEGLFGQNRYSGKQHSFYSNLIFQTILGSTNHTINLGTSFQYDNYLESLNQVDLHRKEVVPGIFTQYTYTSPDKFNGILGLRADHNSLYGLLITPRIHMRYMIGDNTSLRASAGRGFRSANVLSENTGVLASSRMLFFLEEFRIEKAWNYGINLMQDWPIGNTRNITASLDLYRTDFRDRVVMDMDRDVAGVYFHNLDGKSYANSIQAQVSMEPVKRFDISLAYRFSDVKSTLSGELREVPLTSRYKGLLTLSYATPYRKWAFDFTGQLNGQTRLPDTRMNPVAYRLEEYSPRFFLIHAQISKRFKWFEVYAGGENLTDFTQENPILAEDDPFGPHFDASMVWGPLLGRRFYAGIRYTLK